MASIRPTKIAMAVPQLTTDKILIALQYTFTFSASGSQTITSNFPITGDAFVFGAFSTNGGATYQDFGSYSFSSKFTIRPSTTGTVTWDRGTGTIYMTFGLPSTNMTVLAQVIGVFPTNSNTILSSPAFTSGSLAYKSGGNFQKLYMEGNFTQPNGGAQTTTIPHNLGYVPQVRVFSDQGSSRIQMINTVGSEVIKVDANNLTFALGAWGSSTRTLYYRIYYET